MLSSHPNFTICNSVIVIRALSFFALRFFCYTMNAIVSLVHFCEVDGPSVIFCTQAFHANSTEDAIDDISISSGKTTVADQPHSDNSKETLLNRKESFVNNNIPAPASCTSCAFSL